MTSTTPTIIDLKISFLRSQILLLSQPLRPSRDFLTSNAEIDPSETLRQKSIDDALFRLNGLLQKHNKMAYGPQATRHVAEQVDRLYWNAAERGVRGGGGGGEEWRDRGVDYRNDELIEQLPEQYSENASERAPEQAARFVELQGRLKEASERRTAAREKVEEYRRMAGLLRPFGAEGNVQENLVTRNGEVEKELERMRMLMLRVERGMGGLERGAAGADGEDIGDERAMDIDWEEDGDRRVEKILSTE